MATLANLIVRLNADAGNFYKEMKQAQSFTSNIGKTYLLAGKSLTRGVTLPLLGIAGGLGFMVKGVASTGENLFDLSQRTGVSVEKLSSFKLAADLSGASIEDFGKGMRGLASHMFAAQNGSKEAQRAFTDLGVSVLDSNGNLRDSEEVLLDIAERFSQMEDGALKTALAQDIFGRSGMNLIPMLNLGKQGLIENIEEAKKLGIVWSSEAAKSADAFNDSVTKLWGGLDGLKLKIGQELLPTLDQFIQKSLIPMTTKGGILDLAAGGVTKLIEGFGKLPIPIQDGILALGTMAIIVGPFLSFLGMMITNISVLIPLVFELGLAFKALSLGPVGLAIAGGALAVGGGALLAKKLFEEGGTQSEGIPTVQNEINATTNKEQLDAEKKSQSLLEDIKNVLKETKDLMGRKTENRAVGVTQ